MQALITFLEGVLTFISPCVLPMLPVYVLYFAGGENGGRKARTLLRALSFVAGFTLLFVLLGVVFAVGWSPCTGPFLGSAMMMAATQGQVLGGVALLLAYSLGLGVPFVLCALLIDRLKGAFDWIKRHYGAVNRVCGVFLVLVGVLMMTGWYNRLPSLLSQGSAPSAQATATPETIPEEMETEATAVPEATVIPEATPETAEAEATAAPEKAQAAKKPAEVAGPVMRNMAKDFTVYDDAGNAVKLSDYRGKPVVVNFFASWCGPCKMEMPHFEACYQAYGEQVAFLMVNLCAFGNDTKTAAKAMIEAGGYTFPVLFDTEGDAALAYAIRSMPTTIFVSAKGELKGQKIGAIDEQTLRATVQAMAEETAR